MAPPRVQSRRPQKSGSDKISSIRAGAKLGTVEKLCKPARTNAAANVSRRRRPVRRTTKTCRGWKHVQAIKGPAPLTPPFTHVVSRRSRQTCRVSCCLEIGDNNANSPYPSHVMTLSPLQFCCGRVLQRSATLLPASHKSIALPIPPSLPGHIAGEAPP